MDVVYRLREMNKREEAIPIQRAPDKFYNENIPAGALAPFDLTRTIIPEEYEPVSLHTKPLTPFPQPHNTKPLPLNPQPETPKPLPRAPNSFRGTTTPYP
jgi:hypothetical protein